MKGELIPLLFLVLLVAGVLLGYVFYNIFYGTKYEKRVFEREMLDIMRNEIEGLKGYLRQALIYSAHQSLSELAASGGLTGHDGEAEVWICNAPNTFPPSLSRECLEKYTLYYLNIYLGNYSILDLPLRLTKKEFSSCEYQVDSDEVLYPSGTYDPYYDEGNFWVNVSGGIATVSGKGAIISTNLSISEYITKNRFWYLWRIFYEWAKNDVFSPCVCSRIGCACSSASFGEICTSCKDDAEYCADLALKDLQKRFNKSEVECTKNYICCAQGIGPLSCNFSGICITWNNELCIDSCKHKCKDPPRVRSKLNRSFFQSPPPTFNFPIMKEGNETNETCPAWIEARFATMYEFTCEDKKYYVPSDDGPVPLRFTVRALASWRAPGLCPTNSTICCNQTST